MVPGSLAPKWQDFFDISPEGVPKKFVAIFDLRTSSVRRMLLSRKIPGHQHGRATVLEGKNSIPTIPLGKTMLLTRADYRGSGVGYLGDTWMSRQGGRDDNGHRVASGNRRIRP